MALWLRFPAILTAIAAAHAFQAATPQAAPKGSIEGQVVNARTGAPLKRATVRLVQMLQGGAVPLTPQTGRGAVTRPVMMNKETDDQGRFVFTNLDAGRYRIAAERQGFLRQNYGAHKLSGGSTPVAVGDGQAVKQIDFRMMPQGVIAGKVLDEDGEPVANVPVRAMRAYYRNGKRQFNSVANANTSDIGEYRLPELKPGRYWVSAAPRMQGGMNVMAALEPLPATPEMMYAPTYYPSTPDAGAAVPVDVAEGGEIRNIDVRLVKSTVFRVRGRVEGMTQEGGRGRGGMVPVILTSRDGSRGGEGTLVGQARAPEGTFEIRNVPPGQYTAHAQMGGGGGGAVAEAQVDVLGSHVDGLVLRLQTGGDVQGSVKVDGDSAGLDLSNVQVSLRPVGFGGQAPRAKVDGDLKFTLKAVPPIPYAISVSGYPDTVYVKSVQYGGVDVGDDGVTMESGGVVQVVLSTGAPQVDVVVTAGDKAAASAQVLILKDGVPSSVRSTDENGMLTVKGIKPGSYRIVAWEDADPDLLWDPEYLRRFENEGKSVKLDNGSHEAISLKAIPAQ